MKSVDDQSAELTQSMATTPDKAIELIRGIDVLGAVDAIWRLIRCANRYFDYNKPWELAKNGQTQLLGTVLYRSLETIRIVASMTSPIMPEKSEQVLGMLGFPRGYRPIISDIDKTEFPETRDNAGCRREYFSALADSGDVKRRNSIASSGSTRQGLSLSMISARSSFVSPRYSPVSGYLRPPSCSNCRFRLVKRNASDCRRHRRVLPSGAIDRQEDHRRR